MQIDEGKVDAGHFVESMLGRRTVGLFAKFASSLVFCCRRRSDVSF